MALHEIPDDGYKHLATVDCPCRPKAVKRRQRSGVVRTVYVHTGTTRPAVTVPSADEAYDATHGGVR